MKLIIIRHGQTDLNKLGQIQGSEVDGPLNAQGVKTAQEAAKHFNPNGFAAVYSSPLKRAVQTAEIFTRNKYQLIKDDRLKEMDYGSWDGKSIAEIRRKYPQCFDHWNFIKNKLYAKYANGGETQAELEHRCASFIDDLLQKYDQEKVLVVCHGATSRMIIAHLFMGGDDSHMLQMANCGLAEVDFAGRTPELIYYNRVLA